SLPPPPGPAPIPPVPEPGTWLAGLAALWLLWRRRA
ncbi:MAG: PEP-CTERM sorting domain-containing protein, partial [Armatimonadetes bacterium]|nr:PEP-CTERM sorting domain-containing protein [Armatimonadota bacterium]